MLQRSGRRCTLTPLIAGHKQALLELFGLEWPGGAGSDQVTGAGLADDWLLQAGGLDDWDRDLHQGAWRVVHFVVAVEIFCGVVVFILCSSDPMVSSQWRLYIVLVVVHHVQPGYVVQEFLLDAVDGRVG